jgi:hypothetical protein
MLDGPASALCPDSDFLRRELNVTKFRVDHWLATATAILMLASCSGPSLTPQNPSFPQPLSRAHASGIAGQPKANGGYLKRTGTQNFLFVADDGQSCIFLLDPTQPGMPPIGQITDGVNGPAGLSTDSHGTLYVTNQGASPPSVAEYPAGHLRPSVQLTSGINLPWAVAID